MRKHGGGRRAKDARMSKQNRGFMFVWGAPIVLGLLSVFGLLAACWAPAAGTGLRGRRWPSCWA